MTYRYHDKQIEESKKFIYEVNIYRISSKKADILLTKYFTSNEFLDIQESKVIKRFKNFILQQFITLLAAPIEFINENYLPIYELNKKKNDKRKN